MNSVYNKTFFWNQIYYRKWRTFR